MFEVIGNFVGLVSVQLRPPVVIHIVVQYSSQC